MRAEDAAGADAAGLRRAAGQVLLLRCDATPQSGLGHAMRCLALAQAWQDGGGRVLWVSSHVPPALGSRLRREAIARVPQPHAPGSRRDAMHTAAAARAHGAAWVGIDGYGFGADYASTIRGCARVLAIDDGGGEAAFAADLCLNQNAGAGARLYAGLRASRLLLGPRYALLQREFLQRRGATAPAASAARRILVTCGGTDAGNVTARLLRALDRLCEPRLHVRAVVGPLNPHRAALKRLGVGYRLELMPGTHMPALMGWADVAVSAAGATIWELLHLGIPTAFVTTAANQRANARALVQRRVALHLGWHKTLREEEAADRLRALLHSRARRRTLSERGVRMVDGGGAARVAAALLMGAGVARGGARPVPRAGRTPLPPCGMGTLPQPLRPARHRRQRALPARGFRVHKAGAAPARSARLTA